MAGGKEKRAEKAKKENLTLTLRFPKYAGYIDYFLRTSPGIRIGNGAPESVKATVRICDGSGLLVPYEEAVEVPFESSVELTAEGIFSPVFLSEREEPVKLPITVSVSLSSEKDAFLKETAEITALPYDWWEGTDGNPERLAAYVRPRLSDCSRILEEAGARLRKWGESSEFYGYSASNKNTVRKAAAAIFAAIKAVGFEREETELTAPLSAARGDFLKEKRANALELALFSAACLEAAQLHPVIAVGKRAVGVGVWLYNSCFLDTVTDDAEIVQKYISDGINNLSFFDVEDLYSGRNVAFTPSEAHFAEKLKAGFYEYFADVRRCRMAHITPLPLRGKGLKGYELVKEADMSAETAPAPLPELKKLNLDVKQTRNKQWERRLLDLTAKNALLNFTGKNALHIRCGDADKLYAGLSETEMRLVGGGEEREPFGEELTPSMAELAELEEGKGLLRVYEEPAVLSETALRLMRRNREADEETGSKILYLACGFLKYVSKEDGKPKYAPLVLAPAEIRRAKGNEDFSLRLAEGEFFANTTLLEYLKQEFNIDVRGLGDELSGLKISEILAMTLASTARMKGWTVTKDVYVAAFSFQRYLMWNDLHRRFDALKTNAVVSALLEGRMERREAVSAPEEDEGDPSDALTPLPADSSQYSAIALSRTGASFVLHGPPGTGKSQTITNIIANALMDGKRVLFVAEKKAALDVVKKRLDAIGIGEFCLELHSNKTDKGDVLRRLETTLSLAGSETPEPLSRSEELVALRAQLKAPMTALHKKRRLGVSVYQAILSYLQNKDAPDVLDIESSFYDSLTEQKFNECRSRILSAAAAAKECGGVCNSPFENVNTTEYSQALRDKLFCSCEVVITEIKHLKSYLALFLEFYRQKLSTVTQKKIDSIAEIARLTLAGAYDKYFSGVSEEEIYVFYNANRLLDERMSYYGRHFKSLVDMKKEYAEVKKVVEGGGDYRGSRAASAVVKRLMKISYRAIEAEDLPKFLRTAVDIYDAMERIKSVPALAKNFTDRSGEIIFKRRTEYLAGLYDLHETCAATFMDYNPDSFNGMCVRAQSGYTRPVLEGYLKAAEAFAAARNSFLEVTRADRRKLLQEDVPDYFSAKAAALIDNVDLLANWCMYRKTGEELRALGCSFITESLESGRLTVENVLSGFEKNVYQNFLEITIPSDPDLSRLTVGTIEDAVEKFRVDFEAFAEATKRRIRAELISRLPTGESEGTLSVELAAFRRLSKGGLRGAGLRRLFSEVPTLAGKMCPCLLMSPITVAQYLEPQADLFDLVIFDEASQMNTAEAIGSIARARSAIIVGDPKQLPPTSFFHSAYVDEENLESEDLESVLDDCLALGMPERHLLWHYRSKHESLIAFSNSMYYDNRLCTFPSPDAPESKVKWVQVDGTYDRGFTKRNRGEAEALVAEVIRRLKDPVSSRSSMGIVTFSSAQQNDIEKLLSKAVREEKLEGAAYDREEPIFVKNLENVQGDERDVILFSVCYGPDRTGRVSLNFGPLNQTGGWRRLNVAVSRAREEMVVFSSMTSGMIDLSKTTSKGVAGLKAFLEFAEKGRTTLAVKSASVTPGAGIGRFIAEELASYGYECRCDVGASDFKIDVAVIDPRNKRKFLLAVLTDATDHFSVKDRNILQIQALKRGNWHVLRLSCVSYYNNPKREIRRIKELLDKLTGAEKKGSPWIKNARNYRFVKESSKEVAAFFTSGVNDAEIVKRLKEIVAAEEPISRAFLKTRCLASFGVQKSGARMEARLDALIDSCAFRRERALGKDYYYKTDRAVTIGKFRTETEPVLRRSEDAFTPFEILSFIKSVLEERVSVYFDELLPLMGEAFPVPRMNERFASFVRDCVSYGEQRGILVRSVSDRVTLA